MDNINFPLSNVKGRDINWIRGWVGRKVPWVLIISSERVKQDRDTSSNERIEQRPRDTMVSQRLETKLRMQEEMHDRGGSGAQVWIIDIFPSTCRIDAHPFGPIQTLSYQEGVDILVVVWMYGSLLECIETYKACPLGPIHNPLPVPHISIDPRVEKRWVRYPHVVWVPRLAFDQEFSDLLHLGLKQKIITPPIFKSFFWLITSIILVS